MTEPVKQISSDVEASAANDRSRRKVSSELEHPSAPPDGGLHAWFIVFASFLTNGIIFGIHNCYGIIYLRLRMELERTGVADAALKASLVGSLSIGMTFFVSPLAGILIDSIGLRRTAVLGGAIATVGMLASSFALAHVEALYLTYGVLFGAGTSLAYNPSLVILGHYFRKRLGLVSGLVTAGSSVFTFTLPFFLEFILGLGLEATLRILAGMMGLLMVCAVTFVPRLPPTIEINGAGTAEGSAGCSRLWKKYINFSIWKNKKYVIWAIAIPIAMLGYFVPYVHLVSYVKDVLPEADGKVLVLCIGLSSGIGRLIFGKVGDHPKVNRVILQQIAFLSIGVVTMLLTLANSFTWFIILCLFLGLFDGCLIALVGPIAFDFCGPKNASQAIGFLLGLHSLPMTTGPTVAGAMYGALKSYRIPFLLAGCPLIICAFIMLLIHRVKDQDVESDESDGSVGSANNSIKRKSSSKPDVNGNQNIQPATSYGVQAISPNNLKGECVVANNTSGLVLGQTEVVISNRKPVIANLNNWSPAVGRYHIVPPMAYGTTDQCPNPVSLTSFQPNTSSILW
ncbi:monocarboxylate transporter 10-like [Daphnia pulicaria]|uniref:monocarboxylate transporter 10-like n=1 Tax=Daphnia pulicaria TaxID=35523 RepID=UPI001EEBB33F|nr:monocarboxylate transporter 10-like [Daphnia pulicaria]